MADTASVMAYMACSKLDQLCIRASAFESTLPESDWCWMEHHHEQCLQLKHAHMHSTAYNTHKQSLKQTEQQLYFSCTASYCFGSAAVSLVCMCDYCLLPHMILCNVTISHSSSSVWLLNSAHTTQTSSNFTARSGKLSS
jgi:hypothetical protein